MLTTGRHVGAFALTEPNAGSDASKGQTVARLGIFRLCNGFEGINCSGASSGLASLLPLRNPLREFVADCSIIQFLVFFCLLRKPKLGFFASLRVFYNIFLEYFASTLKKSNFSLESFKFSSISYAALWHTGGINMQRGGVKLAFFGRNSEKANKNAVFGTFFWLFSADSCKKPIGRFYALKMH